MRIHLVQPWPDFMTFYGTLATGADWIVPKKYIEKVGNEGFRKHPIGLGPYKFVSYTPGIELVMEAVEGYWRKVPPASSPGRLSPTPCGGVWPAPATVALVRANARMRRALPGCGPHRRAGAAGGVTRQHPGCGGAGGAA